MFYKFDSILIVNVEVEVEVEVGVRSAWYLEVELAQNRRVLIYSTI